jgi:ribosomal protein L11 methyltransferase
VRYIEITARVASQDAEAACDALREVTGAGVSLERPFSQPDLESDARFDETAPVLVRTYARDGRTDRALDEARSALARRAVVADLSIDAVDEEDWAEAWKDHFHVERFGERIVVVPSWRRYDPRPNDVVITLDPGMAFGTGQHETTRMCLEALERTVRPGCRVLDVGCGSGILAIAASRLGAEAFAVDIDEACVRITAENARLNGARLHARQGTVAEAWPFESPALHFEVIVANIIASVIIEFAPSLVKAVAPGGRLIVSGIIGEREGQTRAALQAAGARIDSVRAMGDWRLIEAVPA